MHPIRFLILCLGLLFSTGFGFIDRTGKIVLTFKYPSEFAMVNDFSGGLASVQLGGAGYKPAGHGYIDKSGKVVWAPSK